MHEFSVTQELVRLVLEQCRNPAKVVVELGELTTFKPEPLRFYFETLKQEHPELVGCELEIIVVPGMVECLSCGRRNVVEAQSLAVCPTCESFETRIVQGKDFNLLKIVPS